MERPILSTSDSPIQLDIAPRRARMTLFELQPEHLANHHGRTCQPRPGLGDGVLLETLAIHTPIGIPTQVGGFRL
jgi:hypothetical protein